MTKLFYAFVFPVTTAITPPIIAADTASIATSNKKSESKLDPDEYMKKFMLSVHSRPIKNPALAPKLKVLMFAHRL